MNTKKLLHMFLFLFILLVNVNLNAQGIKIYKSDNTIINVPYSELDSIVTYDAESSYLPESDDAAEAIDLGLPSGTRWASWNIGANSPDEYGNYYAWGETETKSRYSKVLYKYYISSSMGYTDIGSDISGTQYDVARKLWGSNWRIPTVAEFRELINECVWTWEQSNEKNGYIVTGPNGNSIFLPAAGYRIDSSHVFADGEGWYWSSELSSSNNGVFLHNSSTSVGIDNRYLGLSIRPVK